MEALVLIGLLFVAYVLLRRREDRSWVVMHESPAYRPDATTLLHMQLRQRGIRCRLRVIGTGLGSQSTRFLGDRSLGQSFRLLVHENDVDDAQTMIDHLAE